jgi:hypothetical protein
VLAVELTSDNREPTAYRAERGLDNRRFGSEEKSMSCSTNDVTKDHADD